MQSLASRGGEARGFNATSISFVGEFVFGPSLVRSVTSYILASGANIHVAFHLSTCSSTIMDTQYFVPYYGGTYFTYIESTIMTNTNSFLSFISCRYAQGYPDILVGFIHTWSNE